MKTGQEYYNSMIQNGIANIVEKHQLIPVVTVHDVNEVDRIAKTILARSINCVEVTLRSPVAWDAIHVFQEKYGDQLLVGVGTVLTEEDVERCSKSKVDFMVSPGLTRNRAKAMDVSNVPFLPGVATPSEIIQAMELGYGYLKFFPSNLFGGLGAMRSYGKLFQGIKFCPTGGIGSENYKDFLALDNVFAVGGSWLSE